MINKSKTNGELFSHYVTLFILDQSQNISDIGFNSIYFFKEWKS